MQDAAAAVKAVEAAAKAYDYGRGAWPRANVADRISAMEKFIKGLQTMRKEIVNLLLYVSLPSGYYFFFFFPTEYCFNVRSSGGRSARRCRMPKKKARCTIANAYISSIHRFKKVSQLILCGEMNYA
jgi:hypothetical protein